MRTFRATTIGPYRQPISRWPTVLAGTRNERATLRECHHLRTPRRLSTSTTRGAAGHEGAVQSYPP